ncbi:MAG: UMP kinase [Clostridiales Family XIII bacterium]|jgi:uridylate kinase|nr:UMP kinase [Clostridiales Family XIII bacterium]
MNEKPIYNRVLLKVSGEALADSTGKGIDDAMTASVAQEVKDALALGVEVAIVVGGGNFWRGRTSENMNRATADYMGMLATVMNALALQEAFEAEGIPTRVLSAIAMTQVAETYTRRKAVAHLDEGKVVIFAAGSGSPFFSTDTAAALRACEIEADVILLAKKIDAVYSDDPEKNPDAERYDVLTFSDILEKELGVMDSTAASLCRDNDVNIHVFALKEKGNVRKALLGEKIGTIITK